MRTWKDKLIEKFLWAMKPVILWINHHLSIPFIIKRVDGRVFYRWQPQLRRGTVFLTQTWGEGSNFINPGEYKHAAIYFGLGLRSALDQLHAEMLARGYDGGALKRIEDVLQNDGIRDDIPYVIESIEKGVSATDVVTFLTHKDKVVAYKLKPENMSDEDAQVFMSKAATAVLPDLHLPYDYGFTTENTARYCFELVALGYERVLPGLVLPEASSLGHLTFRSSSFSDSKDFTLILDSDSP